MKIEEDLNNHNQETEQTAGSEQAPNAEQDAPAETKQAEPEAADVSGSATGGIPQEYAGTTADPAALHEAKDNPPQARTDEEVYDHIKKQIAERGDAMIPEGATAHQYLVQLIKWAQDVGKIETGASPEASRLKALERDVANLKAKLATHGMAVEES